MSVAAALAAAAAPVRILAIGILGQSSPLPLPPPSLEAGSRASPLENRLLDSFAESIARGAGSRYSGRTNC